MGKMRQVFDSCVAVEIWGCAVRHGEWYGLLGFDKARPFIGNESGEVSKMDRQMFRRYLRSWVKLKKA
jgi:hypothetical protein